MSHSDSRRRRVLIIGVNYSPEPTGIGPYTTGMAEGLAARGWDVEVITGFPHYPWWRIPEEHAEIPARERRSGVIVDRVHHFIPKVHNVVNRSLHEVTFGLRALFAAWRSPDVVVLVSPALLASRMLAIRAKITQIPVVTWVQDIYTIGTREAGNGAFSGLIARVERGLANASARVVVIHDRFRRVMVEDLAVTAPVDVVRNWSHVPDLKGAGSRKMRHRLGWADDDVVVLHAGNMGAKQGLENVVRASQLAAERGSSVRFVLLGDGNMRAQLEAMGGNDRLQFLEPLPDESFHTALASADILLVNELPGLTEMSVPSKLTTYFATGLPVLAAVDATSTTHDEITSAGAGPCVPAGDPAALLDAAESLAADPGMADFGRAGRRYRRALLTEEAAIDAFEGVLDKVMNPQTSEELTLVNSTAVAAS